MLAADRGTMSSPARRTATALVAALMSLTIATGTGLAQEDVPEPGPLTWAAIEGPPGSLHLYGGFAVGSDGTILAIDGGAPRTVWRSADVETWTTVDLPGKKTDHLRDVVAMADGFPAIGGRTGRNGSTRATLVCRSADGSQWAEP